MSVKGPLGWAYPILSAIIKVFSKQKQLAPVADVWVSEASPDVNHNRSGLGVGRWGFVNRTFIKFSLTGLGVPAEKVRGVELRLYGRALYTPLTIEAHFTANYFWNEDDTTWNNQPAPTPLNGKELMGSNSSIPTTPDWATITLDPAFLQERIKAGNLEFTAILKSSSEKAPDNYAYFEDREGKVGFGTQYAPQLRVSYI